MLKIKRARPKAMFMGPVTLVRCDYTNPNQKICGTLFWQISILTLCISRSQPKWSNSKIAGRRFSSDPVFWYTWNSETYSVAIFRKDCALSVCWSLNKFWKILTYVFSPMPNFAFKLKFLVYKQLELKMYAINIFVGTVHDRIELGLSSCFHT